MKQDKQTFYCERHDNFFMKACIPCLDDILYFGCNWSGNSIQHIDLDKNPSEWEGTQEFIDSIKTV